MGRAGGGLVWIYPSIGHFGRVFDCGFQIADCGFSPEEQLMLSLRWKSAIYLLLSPVFHVVYDLIDLPVVGSMCRLIIVRLCRRRAAMEPVSGNPSKHEHNPSQHQQRSSEPITHLSILQLASVGIELPSSLKLRYVLLPGKNEPRITQMITNYTNFKKRLKPFI